VKTPGKTPWEKRAKPNDLWSERDANEARASVRGNRGRGGRPLKPKAEVREQAVKVSLTRADMKALKRYAREKRMSPAEASRIFVETAVRRYARRLARRDG
jgi:hypothetical protein